MRISIAEVLEVLGEIELSPSDTTVQLPRLQLLFVKHNIAYQYVVRVKCATFWFFREKVCTSGDY